jgi:hypothetical protein
MRLSISFLTLFVLCVLNLWMSSSSTAKTFTSGTQKVQLVELYSSQGCSSCPPAQEWLNKLTSSPELWKGIVPVVFHVDYWDYLGWKDPYSSADFSARQREFKQKGLARSVYTPGFFVDGSEWTGFFKRSNLPQQFAKAAELIVDLNQTSMTASYAGSDTATLSLHVAVLGMNLSTYVPAGENRRRTLKENFIVLEHHTFDSDNGKWQAEINIPTNETNLALAAWVTQKGNVKPLQSTGGSLN